MDIEYVIQEVLKGRPVAAIAKELNVGRSTLYKALKKNGFDMNFNKAKKQAIKDIWTHLKN